MVIGRLGILLLLSMPAAAQSWFEQVYDIQQPSQVTLDMDIAVLDLNNATTDQLAALPLMTPIIADSIVKYRNEMGPFMDINELQSLGLFSRDQYNAVSKYLEVHKNLQPKLASSLALIRMGQSLQRRKGYQKHVYLGSPQQLVFQGKYSTGRLDLGFTLEKDQGERLSWDMLRHRYNHLVGYLRFKTNGFLNEIGVGTYQVTWGQGLLIGNGFAMGKGRETIHAIARNDRLNPYLSLNEASYFTGVFAHLQQSKWRLQVFGSYDKLFLTSNNSIYQSGLFRSTNDTARVSTGRWVGGAQASYVLKRLKVNIAGVHYQYEKAGLLSHQGNIWGVSGSWQWQQKNFLFFGEVSILPGNHANQAGFMGAVAHHTDLSLSYRSFSSRYSSPFGQNTFRAAHHIREEGTYAGVRVDLSRQWHLSFFADVFQLDAPNPSGNHGDAMLHLTYSQPTYVLHFYSRARTKSVADTNRIESFSNVVQQYLNITIDTELNEYLSSRTGLWLSIFDGGYGSMIHQDVKLKWKSFSVKTRIAFTNTPAYDNRFYLYEPDVSSTFTIPVYHGVSIRSMIVAAYQPARFLKVEAKYVNTSYRDREQIGSGAEQIDGNTLETIRLQVTGKF